VHTGTRRQQYFRPALTAVALCAGSNFTVRAFWEEQPPCYFLDGANGTTRLPALMP